MGSSPRSPDSPGDPQPEAQTAGGPPPASASSGAALAALVFSILATAAAGLAAYTAWGGAMASRQVLREVEAIRRDRGASAQNAGTQRDALLGDLQRSVEALGAKVDRILERLPDGAVEAPPAAPETPKRPPGTYILVRRGDTLWELARTFLGDATRYRELAEHNGLDRPERLREGILLAIPEDAGR